jgi:HEAT repeat protein
MAFTMNKATGLVLSVSIVASLAGLAVIFVLAFSPPSETAGQHAKLDPPKPEPQPQPSRPHRPTPVEEEDVHPTPKPPEVPAPQPEPPYVPPAKPEPPVHKPESKPDPPSEPEQTQGADSTPDKENPSPDATRYLNSQIAQLASKNNGKSTRIEAAKTIGKLGPAASSASAALCAAIVDRKNREVRDAALHALEKVNPVIYQALHPVIVDENPGTRQEGLRQLTVLGKEANAAAPVLISHMGRLPVLPSSRFRLPGQPIQVHPEEPGDTVRALAAVAADDESVTKQIVSWVRADVAASARAAACAALPSMRGATSAKVESLTQALRLDREPTVRAAAAGALGEFGSRVPAKTVDLVTKAKDYDASAIVREAASRALEKIKVGKDS